ncbi:MAG: hypothetical protein M1818_003768 [Claussenomyces sp. TS43310]|nr:MAG: hypothetical protein M1818_003768 [Claussenomyces sp. TS43310]
MGLDLEEDHDLYMKCADGSEKKLNHYVVAPVKVAGVMRNITLHLVEGRTSCSILLARNWMNSVKAIGDYGRNAYHIFDHKDD